MLQEEIKLQTLEQILRETDQFIAEAKYPEAVEHLNGFIKTHHDIQNPEIYKKLSQVLLKQGKYFEAHASMEKAMLNDPTIPCCKSSFEHYSIKKGLMRMSNDI